MSLQFTNVEYTRLKDLNCIAFTLIIRPTNGGCKILLV